MQTKLPKVTVVTVVFNAEEHIEKTICSVLEQDYPNLEYIVIDGASSDGTVEIIRRYASGIAYWTSEPDNGVYDAMNKGIDCAHGDRINFLNAGDTFAGPSAVSDVIAHAAADDDLVVGNINYISGDSGTPIRADGLAHAYDGMFFCHQALFAKTSVMKTHKFDTALQIAADYDFALKCHTLNYRFNFLDRVVVNYLGGGLSERNEMLNKIESLFVLSRYLDNLDDIYRSRTFAYLEDRSPNPGKTERIKAVHEAFLENGYDAKRFVLYGYGDVGREIYAAYPDNVEMIVDRNHQQLKLQNESHAPEIMPVEALAESSFDYVLISVLGREDDIRAYLVSNLHIPDEKILSLDAAKAHDARS